MKKVIVIGGGAAGLAAAISSARAGAAVEVLEGERQAAKKILLTGGGKCNFTNLDIDADYYNGACRELVSSVLKRFSPYDAISFFESIGVYPLIRDGYVYPRSEKASQVRNALLKECERLPVTIRNNTPVKAAYKESERFFAVTDGYTYSADALIIAAGGLAQTQLSGSGYDIAKAFGHSVTSLKSGLCGIRFCDVLNSCAGLRTTASLSYTDGEACFECEGEIQLTAYGISGIPAMNLSNVIAEKESLSGKEILVLDFVPEMSEEEFDGLLYDGMGLLSFFDPSLAKIFDINDSKKHPKHYSVNICGLKGFADSQVTNGGVCTDEVGKNMESRLINGLFFAGEILNVAGLCGGYNLHFAWASGMLAGCAAAGKEFTCAGDSGDIERWKKQQTKSRRQYGILIKK